VLTDDESRQVAAALDATPALLPYLPELLADLWDLGCSPSLITSWLRDLDLPGESRVLDLGCGKGAAALTLARELGFRVHGVDLFEPFILDARARAEEWGLTPLCRFEKANLHEAVRSVSGYDVVIYASVGVLGRLDTCVKALRRCVRPCGYMLIDNGYLAPGVEPGSGFESLAHREESRKRLVSHGDEILRERVLDSDEMRAIDRRYIESIRSRADALAAAHPEDADLVRGYVDRQESAAAVWERTAVSAAWLLRKGCMVVPRFG
jgi:cyclopropane fatty-acyl-phospholipid synthase-like methyltransferase